MLFIFTTPLSLKPLRHLYIMKVLYLLLLSVVRASTSPSPMKTTLTTSTMIPGPYPSVCFSNSHSFSASPSPSVSTSLSSSFSSSVCLSPSVCLSSSVCLSPSHSVCLNASESISPPNDPSAALAWTALPVSLICLVSIIYFSAGRRPKPLVKAPIDIVEYGMKLYYDRKRKSQEPRAGSTAAIVQENPAFK